MPGSTGCAFWLRCALSMTSSRSEEHTSELQSRLHLVCRLLLEKKKTPLQSLPYLLPPVWPTSEALPFDGNTCSRLLSRTTHASPYASPPSSRQHTSAVSKASPA